ncbi:MAG: hypothetical protein KF889_22655 [Alphaproteobacteria bacterium]|nr:hypothetical protein [Alphaproteobacteria bacterium]MCW5740360.1 hypothetical protein [Alphaproteobacteria bacterium]
MEWGNLPVFDDGTVFEDVQAALAEAEQADGLPMVPPTRRRLEAMIEGVGAPESSYGPMPPLFGEVTPAAVAYQCVLAGCRPAELPLVVTAAASCLMPDFNLLGISTTTGTACVVTIVHGPVAQRLEMNAGTNMLGPGNRANACIGRAVALVLRNIGGARPLIGDMATMGQPGKYTFCFAEADAEDPAAEAAFPSFATRHGVPGGADAVTVLGVSGTMEVLITPPGDTPESSLAAVPHIMCAGALAGGASRKPERGEQALLLPPELARLLGKRDWDLARTQRWLFQRCSELGTEVARQPEDIHIIVAGGAGAKMTYMPLWGGSTVPVTSRVVEL